jgi:hypothetical protein
VFGCAIWVSCVCAISSNVVCGATDDACKVSSKKINYLKKMFTNPHKTFLRKVFAKIN